MRRLSGHRWRIGAGKVMTCAITAPPHSAGARLRIVPPRYDREGRSAGASGPRCRWRRIPRPPARASDPTRGHIQRKPIISLALIVATNCGKLLVDQSCNNGRSI